MAHPEAVGTVDAQRVRLQRVIPMISNGFKPWFIGRFESRADGVHLVGRFTLLPWVKVMLACWLGLALAAALLGAWGVVYPAARPPALSYTVLLPLSVFGLLIPGIGRWVARGDVEWLSNVIRNALGSPAPLEAQIDTTVVDQGALPVTLRVMSALLAFAGGADLLLAAVGIPRIVSPARPAALASADVALGVALLALAFGVYRRQVLAWRLGLGFLVLGTLCALASLWLGLPMPLPPVVRTVQGAVFLVVFVLWARWWYAQRVHFRREPASYPGV